MTLICLNGVRPGFSWYQVHKRNPDINDQLLAFSGETVVAEQTRGIRIGAALNMPVGPTMSGEPSVA